MSRRPHPGGSICPAPLAPPLGSVPSSSSPPHLSVSEALSTCRPLVSGQTCLGGRHGRSFLWGPFPRLPGSPPRPPLLSSQAPSFTPPASGGFSARVPSPGSQSPAPPRSLAPAPSASWAAPVLPVRHRPSCPPGAPSAGPWAAASRDSVNGTLSRARRCTGAHARWLPQTLGTQALPPTCPRPLGLPEKFVQVFHKLVWRTTFQPPQPSLCFIVFPVS